MQDLRYHSRLNTEKQLEIIFRNSLSDYQWYTKRRDFDNLVDLLSLVADLESIPSTNHPGNNEHHRMLRNKPPTPPRRRVKYQDLGVPCYERNWRARILVHEAKRVPDVALSSRSLTLQKVDEVVDLTQESPIHQNSIPETAMPITPGSGWLNVPDTRHEAITSCKRPRQPQP